MNFNINYGSIYAIGDYLCSDYMLDIERMIFIMKKKTLIIMLAAMLTVSMASCGSKNTEDKTDNTSAATESVTEAAADENAGNAADNTTGIASEYAVDNNGVVIGTKQEGAVDEVDMRKAEGKALSETAPDDETLQPSGTLGGIKVSIDDAKLVDTADGQAVVVSFTFKNDSANPMSFDSLFSVSATENGMSFSPLAVMGVEGVNINSSNEQIEAGRSATVQKSYAYYGEEKINLTVQVYGQLNGEMIGKAFSLK